MTKSLNVIIACIKTLSQSVAIERNGAVIEGETLASMVKSAREVLASERPQLDALKTYLHELPDYHLFALWALVRAGIDMDDESESARKYALTPMQHWRSRLPRISRKEAFDNLLSKGPELAGYLAFAIGSLSWEQIEALPGEIAQTH